MTVQGFVGRYKVQGSGFPVQVLGAMVKDLGAGSRVQSSWKGDWVYQRRRETVQRRRALLAERQRRLFHTRPTALSATPPPPSRFRPHPILTKMTVLNENDCLVCVDDCLMRDGLSYMCRGGVADKAAGRVYFRFRVPRFMLRNQSLAWG